MRIDRWFELNYPKEDYLLEMSKNLVHTLPNGIQFYKNDCGNLFMVDKDMQILCQIGYAVGELYIEEK